MTYLKKLLEDLRFRVVRIMSIQKKKDMTLLSIQEYNSSYYFTLPAYDWHNLELAPIKLRERLK
jgi:hypothetical protein